MQIINMLYVYFIIYYMDDVNVYTSNNFFIIYESCVFRITILSVELCFYFLIIWYSNAQLIWLSKKISLNELRPNPQNLLS